TGVDTDERVLSRAQASAQRRGLADRTTFTAADGGTARGPADLVICVGTSHVYGDATTALTALFPMVNPGGRLLYGDATWDPVAPGPTWWSCPTSVRSWTSRSAPASGRSTSRPRAATNGTRSSPASSPTARSGC